MLFIHSTTFNLYQPRHPGPDSWRRTTKRTHAQSETNVNAIFLLLPPDSPSPQMMAKTSLAAAMVFSMSSSEWAKLMKPASYCEGAR